MLYKTHKTEGTKSCETWRSKLSEDGWSCHHVVVGVCLRESSETLRRFFHTIRGFSWKTVNDLCSMSTTYLSRVIMRFVTHSSRMNTNYTVWFIDASGVLCYSDETPYSKLFVILSQFHECLLFLRVRYPLNKNREFGLVTHVIYTEYRPTTFNAISDMECYGMWCDELKGLPASDISMVPSWKP